MTAKQARRFLIVAFVLSLLLHLIVVLFVRWPFRPSPDVVTVVRIERIRPIRIAHVTPPPVTPSPAPSVAPTAVPSAAPRRSVRHRVSPRGRYPVAASPAAVAAAPSPVPVASATPNCAKTDTPVTVAASPPPPEIPPDARTSTTGGTARVRVGVNAVGAVTSTALAQSSGDTQLDLIALAMAREAQYAPATHGCKAVTGQYVYAVRFIPW